MDENDLSYKIIGAALDIHRSIGPGLLESVYEAALVHDLEELGLLVRRQVGVPFEYKSIRRRLDLGWIF